MANREKMIVGLMILFVGLALTGCQTVRVQAPPELSEAVKNGNIDTVKLMIEENPKLVNANVGDFGRIGQSHTPLHLAAQKNHKQLAKLLIAKGANVNAKNDDGGTPLHWAASRGGKDVIKLLIAKGANVNAKDDDGGTPLHWAAFMGHKQIVQLLIANGANVNAKDKRGYTPLNWVAGDNTRVTGYEPDKDIVEDIAKFLISNGADVNAQGRSKSITPLHFAAKHGLKELAELLIAKGANINPKADHRIIFQNLSIRKFLTPFDLAVLSNNKEVAELLIANGADIKKKLSSNGDTHLHVAALYDHKDVVALLIDEGADIIAKNDDSRTALDIAVGEGHKEVADLLRKHGAVEKDL